MRRTFKTRSRAKRRKFTKRINKVRSKKKTRRMKPKRKIMKGGSGSDTTEKPQCPITLEELDWEDAVTDKYGHTYNREAILEWLSRERTSPMGHMPLEEADLVDGYTHPSAPNAPINEWRILYPLGVLRDTGYAAGNAVIGAGYAVGNAVIDAGYAVLGYQPTGGAAGPPAAGPPAADPDPAPAAPAPAPAGAGAGPLPRAGGLDRDDERILNDVCMVLYPNGHWSCQEGTVTPSERLNDLEHELKLPTWDYVEDRHSLKWRVQNIYDNVEANIKVKEAELGWRPENQLGLSLLDRRLKIESHNARVARGAATSEL
jgi:hypothetical protein